MYVGTYTYRRYESVLRRGADMHPRILLGCLLKPAFLHSARDHRQQEECGCGREEK